MRYRDAYSVSRPNCGRTLRLLGDAAAMSSLLPKPQLRGLLSKWLRFHAVGAFLFSAGSAVIYKFSVAEPRKRAYTEYYKNHDPIADFEALREAGVFESVKPKGK
ncbi:PREDICTED: cytochrome c oxidase subunit 6C [Crocodylus porosus]|uniref:Cytochrome c oxidase subunit 6C n=1 Tax=Crocodylus porosus TaxID=8502 RepID=A0A7M4E658_CROPO|nr:PREDICTED: cytochrome c oxidase subunit 6C [Crocodylus porosus]XP_019406747.1 PREDICTED: cytochrome c oxidase subunit 6C [Crocodylus porosus]